MDSERIVITFSMYTMIFIIINLTIIYNSSSIITIYTMSIRCKSGIIDCISKIIGRINDYRKMALIKPAC